MVLNYQKVIVFRVSGNALADAMVLPETLRYSPITLCHE